MLARGILWAMQIAREMGLSKIVVVGDSKVCMDALSNTVDLDDPPWQLKVILEDIILKLL